MRQLAAFFVVGYAYAEDFACQRCVVLAFDYLIEGLVFELIYVFALLELDDDVRGFITASRLSKDMDDFPKPARLVIRLLGYLKTRF